MSTAFAGCGSIAQFRETLTDVVTLVREAAALSDTIEVREARQNKRGEYEIEVVGFSELGGEWSVFNLVCDDEWSARIWRPALAMSAVMPLDNVIAGFAYAMERENGP